MLDVEPIFVFGSNLAGIHGAGAAKYALDHKGALWGKGEGLQGNSYAIPTKDKDLRTLPLYAVKFYVKRFKDYATIHADKTFRLTPIGCGLAGFHPKDIAPMFVDAPINVLLPNPSHDLVSAEFTKIVLEARNAPQS